MRWILTILFAISINASAAEQQDVAVATEEAAQVLPVSEAEPIKETSKEEVTKPVETAVAKPAEKLKVDNRNESEIPLNLENNKKAANEGNSAFRILLTLSILGVVGTGAFIFLRKYSIPKERKHQTQIKILQQHYLGPKKSLAIVRVAGESMLIGITDHNISMIKSLSLLDDEVPEEMPKSFNKVLAGDLDRKQVTFDDGPSDYQQHDDGSEQKNEPVEEFAMGGIKDVVSKRLRGMRSIR
jgi:flagellar protein FliO/FliZ